MSVRNKLNFFNSKIRTRIRTDFSQYMDFSQKSVYTRIILANWYMHGLNCKRSLGSPHVSPPSITLVRNIPLMRLQITDIAWNRMILHHYALTLRCYPSTLVHGVTLHVCTDLYCSSVTSVCNTVTSTRFSQCRYFVVASKECYAPRL